MYRLTFIFNFSFFFFVSFKPYAAFTSPGISGPNKCNKDSSDLPRKTTEKISSWINTANQKKIPYFNPTVRSSRIMGDDESCLFGTKRLKPQPNVPKPKLFPTANKRGLQKADSIFATNPANTFSSLVSNLNNKRFLFLIVPSRASLPFHER